MRRKFGFRVGCDDGDFGVARSNHRSNHRSSRLIPLLLLLRGREGFCFVLATVYCMTKRRLCECVSKQIPRSSSRELNVAKPKDATTWFN